MKKVVSILSIIALFASCSEEKSSSTTTLAVPVSVEQVKKSSIQSFVNTTGTTKAKNSTTLSTEMAGDYFLAKNPRTGRTWKLGDRIKKNETLVVLEDKEYENGIAIEAKKLDLEISKMESEKQASLYDKGGVTLREMKDAEVSYINSKYNYESAQLELAKLRVKSPISGVITELPMITSGTKVASNTEVGTIMDYSKMYMEINLPEKYINDIKNDLRVKITNYTMPDDTLQGRIQQMSPAISEETRTFTGIVEINNPELLFRPGMYAKADIITLSHESTIVIPKELLLSRRKGKTVFVVASGSAAEERVVKVGLENKDNVEIIDGLAENERLVIRGYETLQNRSKVKVVK